jgi:hypothetical protein
MKVAAQNRFIIIQYSHYGQQYPTLPVAMIIYLICIQDYDPDLPPELAAVTGHPDISADNRNKMDNGHTDFSAQGRGPANVRTPVVLSFSPSLEFHIRFMFTFEYFFCCGMVSHIIGLWV